MKSLLQELDSDTSLPRITTVSDFIVEGEKERGKKKLSEVFYAVPERLSVYLKYKNTL